MSPEIGKLAIQEIDRFLEAVAYRLATAFENGAIEVANVRGRLAVIVRRRALQVTYVELLSRKREQTGEVMISLEVAKEDPFSGVDDPPLFTVPAEDIS